MTAEALSAWRSRLDFTQAAAADAIGCGRRSWQIWETGQRPVPKYIALACAAVAKGVKPIGITRRSKKGTTMMNVSYTLSASDDGYRVRDWFRGGQSTLDAAENAATADEADQILRAAYKGADVDDVRVTWQVEPT